MGQAAVAQAHEGAGRQQGEGAGGGVGAVAAGVERVGHPGHGVGVEHPCDGSYSQNGGGKDHGNGGCEKGVQPAQAAAASSHATTGWQRSHASAQEARLPQHSHMRIPKEYTSLVDVATPRPATSGAVQRAGEMNGGAEVVLRRGRGCRHGASCWCGIWPRVPW